MKGGGGDEIVECMEGKKWWKGEEMGWEGVGEEKTNPKKS